MQNQQATAYQENLLCDTLDRMRRNPEGRKVVHIHLSRLMPMNREPLRVKIIRRMFANLEGGMHVQVFPLTNLDLVMTVNSGAQRDVNNICNRIRALLESDPITFTDDAAGNDQFVTWYDLEVDSNIATEMAVAMRDEAIARRNRPGSGQPLPSMTPADLDVVQKQLAVTNVIPFVRDQAALRLDPAKNQAAIEFREFYLSVGDLGRQIAPGVNLFGDRWLFQDLSRTMDLRMLETIVRAPHARKEPIISLNLNLESISTPAFAAFIERIPKGQRIIIEIQAIDVLAGVRHYIEVHDVMSSMGHALLIDGLSPTTLQMLDVPRLMPHYAKIMWSPELQDMMDPNSNKSAAYMIDQVGADKVILARCDSETAMSWGLKSGIRVFQGHFLDAMSRPRRRQAGQRAG